MNKATSLLLLLIVLIPSSLFSPLSFPHEDVDSEITSASASSVYFPVGAGGSDVIAHQIVRTDTDHLYLFANQQSSSLLRVYRTTGTGLPDDTSDFASPVVLTESSEPIGVDAVYDGGNIIHVLVNLRNGDVKDHPFDVTTNTFKSSILLASNGGSVSSVLYVGTSGVTGMVDLDGNLQVAYWTDQDHIRHRAYSYDASTNTLTPLGSFTQVDTSGNANHPALAISPLDNSATVAWVSEADNPPKIRTRTRADNGVWGAVQSASTSSVWTSTDNGINIDQGPSLIVDSSGMKHLTYIQSFDGSIGDYGRIHYVTDTGSGWNDQALDFLSHDPALAVNAAGEIYIIGHGHPRNAPATSACLSEDEMCIIKKNTDGTWEDPQLFATPPGGYSFDSSPSVKWSVMGFNRPETIEFVFFMTPYDSPTLYYGNIQGALPPGTTFADVPDTYWAYDHIERLYNAGVTGGCSTNPLVYCPEGQVTRAQMAVFLERGLHYPTTFNAPNVAPTFSDTIGHWAEDWIEALKNDGVTAGCATGLYCPENPVTRAQMAVFLLKAKYGSSYTPPAVGTSTGFNDVPTNHWAAAWIKQLAAEQITGGCGGGNYCPESPVTRAQMAVFLVKTFNLP